MIYRKYRPVDAELEKWGIFLTCVFFPRVPKLHLGNPIDTRSSGFAGNSARPWGAEAAPLKPLKRFSKKEGSA
ncbi:MAG: hypothetical protein D6814_12995, partial [Calditrichaeota bacterium]